MKSPRAYYNGQFVPDESVCVRPFDAGFVQGTTVAEQLRTFGGRLFRLREHLERFERSLSIVGIELGVSQNELAEIAETLAEENHRLLAPGDDLGLAMWATPGAYSPMAPVGATTGPTLCGHTFPLPFDQWADKYEQGQSLVVSEIRQVPAACWPPELKCRSRMHYYLADRQARAIDRASRALLLDLDGFVCEASTANVTAYFQGEGLVSPPASKILPGISVAALGDLARAENIPLVERDLSPEEFASADEALLTSTSICVLPITSVDGRKLGDGRPGPIFRRLLQAWGKEVGVDIASQAATFRSRPKE